MVRDPATVLRRVLVVLLVFSLLSPAATGAAVATSDDSVTYVRSVEEIRGHLVLSVEQIEAGDREAGAYHAGEPLEEQWPIVSQQLGTENATLEAELESALERVEAEAGNASAEEYATLVREEVLPLLDRAETAPVSAERVENATFNANVVAGLLERAGAEYTEGVTDDGSVEEASDYRAAKAFTRQAEKRYEATIRDAVSDHAAEELDELFERIGTTMDERAPPAEVDRLANSITHELAEYTGIEAEAAGEGAETIERIETDLHEAVEAYEAGNPEEAKSIIKGTYLSNFEGIEGTLIEEDPELVESLEADFNEELPGLIDDGADVSEVREHVEDMESKLHEAEEILVNAEETEITITKGNETTTTDEGGTDGTTETTDTLVPGFGIVVALVAILVGTVASRRLQ